MKEDFKNKASRLESLELKYKDLAIVNPEQGPSKRGLIVTKDYDHSELMLEFNPLIKTLRYDSNDKESESCQNICQNCFDEEFIDSSCLESERKSKIAHNLIVCESCEIYRYCDEKCLCEHKDKIHSTECPILRRYMESNHLQPYEVSEFVRLGIRLYALCQKSEIYKSRTLQLTSHSQSIRDSEGYEWVGKCADSITRSVKKQNEVIYNDYIFTLLSICLVNSSVLMNEYKETIGLSLDLEFSMINHSCIPNTITIPLGHQRFCLVLSKSLTSHQELTTNYCFTNLPRELRQAELSQRFFFNCKCSLCSQKFDPFLSYNCPNCGIIFCSFDLAAAFGISVGNVTFRNQVNNFECVNCLKNIDYELFTNGMKNHQRLLAIVMNFFQENGNLTGTNIQTNQDQVLDEAIQVINDDKLTNPISLDLAYVIAKYNYYSYSIEPNNLEAMLQTCDTLRKEGLVPSYCFPLNLIYESILKSFENRSQPSLEQDLNSSFQLLKMNFITVFELYIPSDLSQSKLSLLYHFKDLSVKILTVAETVILSGKNQISFDARSYDEKYLCTMLIKCSFFFGLQALEGYSGICKKMDNSPILDELFEVMYQIRQICLSQEAHVDPKQFPWYQSSTKNLKASMFIHDLKDIFMMMEIKFSFKKNQFKFFFADRNLVPIFKNLEDMDLKKFAYLDIV